MELSIDAMKILASKLDAPTLEALRGSTKTVRATIDVALSDDLTYKLITEELLGMELPDYRTSWKRIYQFFLQDPVKPTDLKEGEKRLFDRMSPLQKKLYTALFSSNPFVVRIAILSGVDPAMLSNRALNNAFQTGDLEVAEVLLADERVVGAVDNAIVLRAFESGNIDVIVLVLDMFDHLLDEDDKEQAVSYVIQSGNVEALELTLDRLTLSLEYEGADLNSAVMSGNPDMVHYVLDIVPDLREEYFLDIIKDSIHEDKVLEVMLHHPRVIPFIRPNINWLLQQLIMFGIGHLVDELLAYPELDASANQYKALSNAILMDWPDLVVKLLNRPEVHPSPTEAAKIIATTHFNSALDALLTSDKIVLDEEAI